MLVKSLAPLVNATSNANRLFDGLMRILPYYKQLKGWLHLTSITALH